MNEKERDIITELSSNNTFKTKSRNDIINDIKFASTESSDICNDIITELEKTMASDIKAYKTVQIPHIGCLKRDKFRTDISKYYTNFKAARQNMTLEEYKSHVRAYVKDMYDSYRQVEARLRAINRLKFANKNKYKEIGIKLGKAYAEMYIFSIYLLKEIPYDEEWELKYNELSDAQYN